MAKIDIINVVYDGYERLIKFKIQNDSNLIMWAHAIAHNEYIESGLKQCNPIERVEASFTIELVLNINPVIEDKTPMVIQEIEKSSHIRCIGIIDRVISPDSFICNIEKLGQVTVELEKSNLEIFEGMKVEFAGNLEIEIV